MPAEGGLEAAGSQSAGTKPVRFGIARQT